MYNQNQIRMRSGVWGSRIEFEMCDEFENGRIAIDIQVIPEITEIMSMARKEKAFMMLLKVSTRILLRILNMLTILNLI